MIHIHSLLPLNQLFKGKEGQIENEHRRLQPQGEVNKVAPRRNSSPFDFNSYCTGEAEGAAALS